MSLHEVSPWPHIEIVIAADGTGTVNTGAAEHPVQAGDVAAAREHARSIATDTARRIGRPVRGTVTDPSGTWPLIFTPDGTTHPDTTAPERTAPAAPRSVPPTPSPAPTAPGSHAALVEAAGGNVVPIHPNDDAQLDPAAALPAAPVDSFPTPAPGHGHGTTTVTTIAGVPQMPVFIKDTKSDQVALTRRSLRDTTFLVDDARPDPAVKGVRGLLTRIGIKSQPSAAELAERADTDAVSQHWPGTRTIAVVNRKGGSNKTPTVAALAAVFARYGGGGVLAWDNNENQGTLGWRTERGTHDASVLDVLRDQDRLLADSARQADIDGYLHHQVQDKYDVLRSDENDEGDHEIQADEVHTVHKIAEKYRRLIIMDSGNTARAANWRAMIEHTTQLVIPTTTMEDRAEAAKLTLQTLAARDEHSAQLAKKAVVIISQWKPEDRAEAQRIAELFTPLVRAVVTVPYDPALKAGRIRYAALKPTTQRAWLAAAAAVARGL